MSVLALDALVRVELRLEKGAEGLQLGLLGLAGGVGGACKVALEALDAVLDGRVADLGLGDIVLELLVGLGVGGAERALVQLADGLNVTRQARNVVAERLDPGEEVLLRERLGAAGGGSAGVLVGGRLRVFLELIVVLGVWVRLARGEGRETISLEYVGSESSSAKLLALKLFAVSGQQVAPPLGSRVRQAVKAVQATCAKDND